MIVQWPGLRDVGVVWPLAWLARPDGGAVLVVGGQRGGVRAWDPVAGVPVTAFDVRGSVNAMLVCHPTDCGPLLVVATDTGVEWFDALTGTHVHAPTTRDTVWDLAAATTGDGTVTVFGTGYQASHPIHRWDASTGMALPDLGEHHDHITAVTTLTVAGGTLLVAAGGRAGTIHRWDPATAAPYGRPLAGHDTTITSMDTVRSANGQVLLVSADINGEVRRWDPATGVPIGQPFTAHAGGNTTTVAAVRTSSGAHLLTSGGEDQVIRRWDPVTGSHLGDLGQGFAPVVTRIHGRPTVAAGGSNGLYLYPLPD